MPVARKHHYVPQFYLRKFTHPNSKERLCVFDRIKVAHYTAAIKDVACERDFNTVDIEGLEPDAIERDLASVEDKFDQALKAVINRGHLGRDGAFDLVTELMALIAVRNPARRRNFDGFVEHAHRVMFDAMTATPQIWAAQLAKVRRQGILDAGDPEEDEAARLFARKNELKFTLRNEARLGMEFANIARVVELLHQRRWLLLRCDRNTTGFVTSDHPVALYFQKPVSPDYAYGIGFATPGTEVLFPLCNHLAMVGSFDGAEGTIDAGEDVVAQANLHVVLFADRQVFSRAEDFTYVTRERRLGVGAQVLKDTRFRRLRPAS